MFKEIEELYKREGVSNKIEKKIYLIFIISYVILCVFGFFNIPIALILLGLFMVFVIKKVVEKELNMKFYFSLDCHNGKTLNDIINRKEYEIIKQFVQEKDLYNDTIILNIIDHYRKLIVPKMNAYNLWNIIFSIFTLIIPFVSKDGLDVQAISNVAFYYVCLLIMGIILYFPYKETKKVVEIFQGKYGMYKRLEEIFSEILIEMNQFQEKSYKKYNKKSRL